MKGPGMRLDLDVRRIWQCPVCGRQLRSNGSVVTKYCGCGKEETAMRLIEPPRPKPVVRVPDPAEGDPEFPELSDFPTDLPVNPVNKEVLRERAALDPLLPPPRPSDSPESLDDDDEQPGKPL